MKKLSLMIGLSLLEVMVACFILTSVSLVMLRLLMQQRVSIDEMRERSVALSLLTSLADQLSTTCTAARQPVIGYWQQLATKLLPYYQADFYCAQAQCSLCLIKPSHNEGKICLTLHVVASPCLN